MRKYKNTFLIFYLSLLLDKDGNKRLDLVTSDRIDNLDNFIKKNFSNHQDVRRKYDQEISEYCLDNMDFIKEENTRNHRNWTGAITILFPVEEYNYQKNVYETRYIKIPVMYKDGIELQSKDECLKIIRERLKDRTKFKELFEQRGFLLSGDEIRCYYQAKNYINEILNGGSEKKAYDDLVDVFCKRISKMPDHISYYYFRCLMDIFELAKKTNKTRVKIKSVETDKLAKIGKREQKRLDKEAYEQSQGIEIMESAPEEFAFILTRAIETGDYESLYNMYSLDEIERFTRGKRN